MNKLSSLLIGTGLCLINLTSMAATMTSMDTNWTCKTNASSTSVEAEKMADKQMSETAKSAADAYTFAAQNCRDCTKITCEASK